MVIEYESIENDIEFIKKWSPMMDDTKAEKLGLNIFNKTLMAAVAYNLFSGNEPIKLPINDIILK